MWEYNYTNELYHHGVKGMKWGHRRASYNEAVSTARANKKAAYKSFNKSFNKSYGYDYTLYTLIKESG